MKLFSKLSAVGSILVLGSVFAAADTVTFGSYGTSNGAGGATVVPTADQNTAVTFGGNATFNIGSGGPTVWAPAGGNSSWVSYNGQTGPTGNVIASNGVYTYTTTFTVAGGSYNGVINVLADDTSDVILDGTKTLISAGAIGLDTHCADGIPNCLQVQTYSFAGETLLAGLHTLTFNVQQTGLVYEGLDFYGGIATVDTRSVDPVPEPGTLLLLGTGLIGSAGSLARRMRKA